MTAQLRGVPIQFEPIQSENKKGGGKKFFRRLFVSLTSDFFCQSVIRGENEKTYDNGRLHFFLWKRGEIIKLKNISIIKINGFENSRAQNEKQQNLMIYKNKKGNEQK